jgi:hypothetical protein
MNYSVKFEDWWKWWVEVKFGLRFFDTKQLEEIKETAWEAWQTALDSST